MPSLYRVNGRMEPSGVYLREFDDRVFGGGVLSYIDLLGKYHYLDFYNQFPSQNYSLVQFESLLQAPYTPNYIINVSGVIGASGISSSGTYINYSEPLPSGYTIYSISGVIGQIPVYSGVNLWVKNLADQYKIWWHYDDYSPSGTVYRPFYSTMFHVNHIDPWQGKIHNYETYWSGTNNPLPILSLQYYYGEAGYFRSNSQFPTNEISSGPYSRESAIDFDSIPYREIMGVYGQIQDYISGVYYNPKQVPYGSYVLGIGGPDINNTFSFPSLNLNDVILPLLSYDLKENDTFLVKNFIDQKLKDEINPYNQSLQSGSLSTLPSGWEFVYRPDLDGGFLDTDIMTQSLLVRPYSQSYNFKYQGQNIESNGGINWGGYGGQTVVSDSRVVISTMEGYIETVCEGNFFHGEFLRQLIHIGNKANGYINTVDATLWETSEDGILTWNFSQDYSSGQVFLGTQTNTSITIAWDLSAQIDKVVNPISWSYDGITELLEVESAPGISYKDIVVWDDCQTYEDVTNGIGNGGGFTELSNVPVVTLFLGTNPYKTWNVIGTEPWHFSQSYDEVCTFRPVINININGERYTTSKFTGSITIPTSGFPYDEGIRQSIFKSENDVISPDDVLSSGYRFPYDNNTKIVNGINSISYEIGFLLLLYPENIVYEEEKTYYPVSFFPPRQDLSKSYTPIPNRQANTKAVINDLSFKVNGIEIGAQSNTKIGHKEVHPTGQNIDNYV